MSAKKEEIIIEVRANYTDALMAISRYQQETEKLRMEQVKYKEELKDGTLKKEAYRLKMNNPVCSALMFAFLPSPIFRIQSSIRNPLGCRVWCPPAGGLLVSPAVTAPL